MEESLAIRSFSSSESVDELRIVQFNILADGLSGARPDCGGFSEVPKACLNWKFRRQRIVEEILSCRPHVIGLEEVDRPDDFLKIFTPMGYDYVFKPKPSSPCLEFSDLSDGCLLMYDTKRLKKLNQPDESFSLGNNQVSACVIVEDLNNNHIYVLSVAHFKASKNEHGESIRTQQAEIILSKLQDLSNKYSATATFLCADLNGVPTGNAYKKIVSKMNSSMSKLTGSEPEFTTVKKRGTHEVQHTIDYIFYAQDKDILRPVRFLEIPKDLGFIPNWKYPSDHFMLCVGFSHNK
jgi:mRNA deadenylase 3'-5' endonuclease subunit Ccr4